MSDDGKVIHFISSYGTYYAGEHRHPEVVIREWYPDACDLEPQPIADQWKFRATPRDDAPDFFRR